MKNSIQELRIRESLAKGLRVATPHQGKLCQAVITEEGKLSYIPYSEHRSFPLFDEFIDIPLDFWIGIQNKIADELNDQSMVWRRGGMQASNNDKADMVVKILQREGVMPSYELIARYIIGKVNEQTEDYPGGSQQDRSVEGS